MSHSSLDSQLFKWDSVDYLDGVDMQFYNCVLSVDIGPYSRGTVFPIIVWATSRGQISFIGDNDVEHVYALHVTVGKLLFETQPEAK